MRINIIGPSASGKTTLAKKLSKQLGLKHVNLDYVFYKSLPNKRRRVRSKTKLKDKFNKLVKSKNWVVEGVNPVKEIMEAADIIIHQQVSLFTSLFRQWKRYLTDSKQRKEHGFFNNIKLSTAIIRQYLHEDYPVKDSGPKGYRAKKVEEFLRRHRNKVIEVKSNEDINTVLNELNMLKK